MKSIEHGIFQGPLKYIGFIDIYADLDDNERTDTSETIPRRPRS